MPPRPSTTAQAQALYDCDTTEADELAFQAGEVFVLLEQKAEDWWQVRNSAGKIGLVPAN